MKPDMEKIIEVLLQSDLHSMQCYLSGCLQSEGGKKKCMRYQRL